MRELTYKSFLKEYVNKLSYGENLHLNNLHKEAEYKNPRLREVLLLHMLETYKVETIRSKLKHFKNLNKIYIDYEDSLLSKNYQYESDNPFNKVYNSFVVRRDYHKNRNDFKLKLIEKIKRLQQQKNISSYRIYTDLGLNPGNVNYALKHNDTDKLSEENLKEIAKFLEMQS